MKPVVNLTLLRGRKLFEKESLECEIRNRCVIVFVHGSSRSATSAFRLRIRFLTPDTDRPTIPATSSSVMPST